MTHQLNCQPVTTPSQFVIAVVQMRVTEALGQVTSDQAASRLIVL